jgi:ketosteroid isomerase-like protein
MVALTDDAVIVSPDGSTAVGRNQFTEQLTELTRLPGFAIEFELTTATVSDDGTAGVIVGKSAITFTTPEGSPTLTEQPLLTVWRKDADQTWRCYVDAVMGTAEM